MLEIFIRRFILTHAEKTDIEAILAHFLWVDILVVIIVVQGCWAGFRKGALIEVFKNFSLFLAVFIGLHFYIRLGDSLIHVLQMLKPVAHIFSYILVVSLTIGILRMARDGLIVLLKDDKDKCSPLSRITGLILGFGRALVLSSLILVGCLVIGHEGLTASVRRSFLGSAVLPLSPKLYSGMYQFIVHPLFRNEPKNVRVLMLL